MRMVIVFSNEMYKRLGEELLKHEISLPLIEDAILKFKNMNSIVDYSSFVSVLISAGLKEDAAKLLWNKFWTKSWDI